eukprot:TRINITY_DN12411_c0_g1::TRINITY_DN12411_c0_g1_i1::g.4913::m.4913 TRINITY_DN12411_c0_g1::TRINITY_DN12411_c0_g1_i1::g.4913  ORF type:complete len:431 (+),score=3.62,N36/PF11438.3/0.061 TRINITY_DN12411_c0_g1_i1:140-1432(+)
MANIEFCEDLDAFEFDGDAELDYFSPPKSRKYPPQDRVYDYKRLVALLDYHQDKEVTLFASVITQGTNTYTIHPGDFIRINLEGSKLHGGICLKFGSFLRGGRKPFYILPVLQCSEHRIVVIQAIQPVPGSSVVDWRRPSLDNNEERKIYDYAKDCLVQAYPYLEPIWEAPVDTWDRGLRDQLRFQILKRYIHYLDHKASEAGGAEEQTNEFHKTLKNISEYLGEDCKSASDDCILQYISKIDEDDKTSKRVQESKKHSRSEDFSEEADIRRSERHVIKQEQFRNARPLLPTSQKSTKKKNTPAVSPLEGTESRGAEQFIGPLMNAVASALALKASAEHQVSEERSHHMDSTGLAEMARPFQLATRTLRYEFENRIKFPQLPFTTALGHLQQTYEDLLRDPHGSEAAREIAHVMDTIRLNSSETPLTRLE